MTVPTRTTFNAGASTAGWACVGTACTFPVGALAGNGGTSTVHFVVTVDDPLAPNVATIVATDSVADDGTGGADPHAGEQHRRRDTDTVPLIDLSVALAGGLAHQGIPYVITATISNGGPASATVVLTHIALPAGLSYVSDDGAGALRRRDRDLDRRARSPMPRRGPSTSRSCRPPSGRPIVSDGSHPRGAVGRRLHACERLHDRG